MCLKNCGFFPIFQIYILLNSCPWTVTVESRAGASVHRVYGMFCWSPSFAYLRRASFHFRISFAYYEGPLSTKVIPPPFLAANWLQCHIFSLCLSLRISTAEGQPWLEWEQRVFKCKVIHSAVEGGRLGLQVEEDIRKGGLCVCFISFFFVFVPFC